MIVYWGVNMVGLNGEVMIGIAVLNTGLYPGQFVGVGAYGGKEEEEVVWRLWFLLIQYPLNNQ